MNTPPDTLDNFAALVEIMAILRSPTGCPWDKKQDHESLIPHAIEEVYELVDAIEANDKNNIKEELGDVLLQVVFHAQLAKEANEFDITDVLNAINTKLVTRHTHVFGSDKAQNEDDALATWNNNKKKEKNNKPKYEFSFPSHLPSIQSAQKIGSKTKQIGFDWGSPSEIFAHLESEIKELSDAMASDNTDHAFEELGDVFFCLSQLARHLKMDGDAALRAANKKFERRYFKMHKMAESNGQNFEELSLKEMEALWAKVKQQEHA